MVTKFKHPSEDYYVLNMVHIPYVESSHAWKLLQCSHSLLTDNNGGEITWDVFHNLLVIQELTLGNKV
jgi:hypothetical protein